ncbi:MAG TPA: LysR family transcriptional regulator [Chloroflexota bacterium]|nr:LysR family transcriptional regulator [Chloroflexota bacterium]
MSLTIHNLRVFCSVVELGSVSAAAERLYLSPSAVSLHVRLLSDHFGTQLFQREGRRLVPTEAGQVAYQHATTILQQLGDAEAALRDLQAGQAGQAVVAGSVTVGSYLLPDILARFAAEHPRAQLVLQVYPATEMFERILHGELDFGVTLEAALPVNLVSEPLGDVDAVVVAAPGQGLGPADQKELLERSRWICAPRGTRGREMFDHLVRQAGIARTVSLELGHPECIKRMVQGAVGIAITYRFVVHRELANGTLQQVPLPGVEMRSTLHLVHRPRKYFGPLAALLLAFLRREVPRFLERLRTIPQTPPSGTPGSGGPPGHGAAAT